MHLKPCIKCSGDNENFVVKTITKIRNHLYVIYDFKNTDGIERFGWLTVRWNPSCNVLLKARCPKIFQRMTNLNMKVCGLRAQTVRTLPQNQMNTAAL